MVARKLRLDVRGIVTIIAINLAFSLFYRSTIAWQDHVGGLIVGVVTTAAFAYAPRKNRTAHPGRRRGRHPRHHWSCW